MASNSPAVITAPTCRFKTKRKGAHIGIIRADICGDCLVAMQASLVSKGPAFCHDCGYEPEPGDLMAYFYRDTGAMLLCNPCAEKFGAKLTSELDAERSMREALIIKSLNAREQIYRAETAQQKMTLWQQWREILGPRRKV